MNRELLVRLIKKNIDELIMLTDGFMEMTSYPEAIVSLAKNKTDDIWNYIHQLGNIEDVEKEEIKEVDEVHVKNVDIETNANSPDAKKDSPKVVEDSESTNDDLPEDSETPVQTLADKLSSTVLSRNEALAKESNGGINTNIGQTKIDDIRQAISLGDRFRFQRELFNNNGEEMNKTLAYINKLATYEEIVNFLSSKYTWAEDNASVEDFYRIIKRKF